MRTVLPEYDDNFFEYIYNLLHINLRTSGNHFEIKTFRG